MEYDEYIQHLKDSLPVHQRCHSVFSEKTCIYRCYDCATGVSSCLCSECFEAGDHEVTPVMIIFTFRGITILVMIVIVVVVVIAVILSRGDSKDGVRNINMPNMFLMQIH